MIILLSSCLNNLEENNNLLEKEAKIEIIKENNITDNLKEESVITFENNLNKIEDSVLLETEEFKLDKSFFKKMKNEELDSDDYGQVGNKIKDEDEFFEIIGKLEKTQDKINYFKLWNELQFAGFAGKYCTIEGYNNLLKKIKNKSELVKKSGLWVEILNKCKLDKVKILGGDNYIQLESIHNQYLAQQSFEELVKFDCNNLIDIKLIDKCSVMKYSLIKFNNKTCNDLVYERDKEVCNNKGIIK